MQDAPSSPSLPQDLAVCHAIIVAKEALLAEQTAALVDLQTSRETLSQENAELNLTIQKLLARLRGHRSERHEDPAQQQLDFGQDAAVQDGLADAAAEQEAAAETRTEEILVRRRKKKPKQRSEQLPAHLERYEVVAEVPAADQQCAEHGPRQLIGYDMTETLEFQRPKLRVRVTKYPKFVCPAHAECGVKQPERPASLVEGNRYDTSIAAEIIVAKHAYHSPIYRQQDWFAGSGWMPDRSTLLYVQASGAYRLQELYDFKIQGPICR